MLSAVASGGSTTKLTRPLSLAVDGTWMTDAKVGEAEGVTLSRPGSNVARGILEAVSGESAVTEMKDVSPAVRMISPDDTMGI